MEFLKSLETFVWIFNEFSDNEFENLVEKLESFHSCFSDRRLIYVHV